MMIGITIGDPSGIGPEIINSSLSYLGNSILSKVILISPIFLFEAKKFRVVNSVNLLEREILRHEGPFLLDVFEDVDFSNIKPGNPSVEGAKVALKSIDVSITLLKLGIIHGVVNAPVSKSNISRFFSSFKGHTGYYATAFGVKAYNMAFYSEDIKLVLLTDHIPLKCVSEHITIDRLGFTLENAYKWAKWITRRDEVLIGICGLNPHAGEEGLLGNEEEIIKEAIKRFDKCKVIGPLSPDTAFLEYFSRNMDLMICLYHDQGLIPFKMKHFNDGINVTLGLHFIRCSPDHGTAFGIAGKGIADPSSMINAIKYAFLDYS